MNTAIIVAGGNSTRFGQDKQFFEIKKIPVLIRTLLAFDCSALIDNIVVVTKEENFSSLGELISEYGISKPVKMVEGGDTRQRSVMNGLMASGGSTIVAIHDGARPFVSASDIDALVEKAGECGAIAPAVTIPDTVIEVSGDRLLSVADRDKLRLIQTPQVFDYEKILSAHKKAEEDGFVGTDDCSLIRYLGGEIVIAEGNPHNIKITSFEDVERAEFICERLGEI